MLDRFDRRVGSRGEIGIAKADPRALDVKFVDGIDVNPQKSSSGSRARVHRAFDLR